MFQWWVECLQVFQGWHDKHQVVSWWQEALLTRFYFFFFFYKKRWEQLQLAHDTHTFSQSSTEYLSS
jgi:hypothetical protein